MSQATAPASPARRIKQARSRKTYEALIRTAFRMLEKHEFESITVADLARTAGYSVGAFYARFRSKDEFFEAMLVEHIEDRARSRERIFATSPDATLINDLIEDLVSYYWKRRRFWRAALVRSMRDSAFWEPVRQHGHAHADALVARIGERTQRKLTRTEDTNVRFAFQIALGTVNNAIINRPGPIFIGQRLFVENLARAFRLVCDYDRIMGFAPAPTERG